MGKRGGTRYMPHRFIYRKIVTNFSKFDVKLGLGNTILEITLCAWVFKYLVRHFFRISIGVLKMYQFFQKFQKPYLPFKI